MQVTKQMYSIVLIIVSALNLSCTLTNQQREGLNNLANNIDDSTFNIGFAGDSYAAGEGNPVYRLDVGGAFLWYSEQCHLGGNGRFSAVDNLDTRKDGSSLVTIVSNDVSCSGATISNGLMGGYRGIHKVGTTFSILDPQIDQLSEWLRVQRLDKLDALVISIGGNDIGFAEVVTKCLDGTALCSQDTELAELLEVGLQDRIGAVGFANLESSFSALKRNIEARFEPDPLVIIVGYTDPLRNTDANYCHQWDDGFPVRPSNFVSGDLQGPTQIEYWLAHINNFNGQMRHLTRTDNEWIYNKVISRINQSTKQIAENFGWRYVDVEGLSRRHGYCSQERWFNTLKDSNERQGDFNGTAHPNDLGYRAYEQAVQKALVEALNMKTAPPPLIREDARPLRISQGVEFEPVGEPASDGLYRGVVGHDYRVQAMLYPTAKTINAIELQVSKNRPLVRAFENGAFTSVPSTRYTKFGFENVLYAPLETTGLRDCDWMHYRWAVRYSDRGSEGVVFSESKTIRLKSPSGQLQAICQSIPQS